jgi:cytochrome c-type biogenesis protein CcmH
MKKYSLILVFVVLAVLVLTVPALAQDGEPPAEPPTADEVNAVAKNMYCPVCENIPLDVCGTQACAQWRQQIADMLSEGYSEEEIYDYFVAQYGDRVLAEPPREGLNWLAYIVPPVVILAGVVFLVQYLRKMRAPAPAKVESKPEVDQDYQSRIEEELKKRL